jgi:hypothetical protein
MNNSHVPLRAYSVSYLATEINFHNYSLFFPSFCYQDRAQTIQFVKNSAKSCMPDLKIDFRGSKPECSTSTPIFGNTTPLFESATPIFGCSRPLFSRGAWQGIHLYCRF